MTPLKGTQTEKNLKAALAGESIARNKYTYFAAQAHAEGKEDIAALFEKMADNEKEHAKIWFKLVFDGIDVTEKNLQIAAKGENDEWSEMYPAFAATAREEGLEHVAEMFEKVAQIEKNHEKRFLEAFMHMKMAENKTEAPVVATKPSAPVPAFRCMFCGHTQPTNGVEAPVVCPVCSAIAAFERTVM